jgi:protein-S-isoprenylcysteine O-methyltransferase Ste14
VAALVFAISYEQATWFLVVVAWAAWIFLGSGRRRPEVGDKHEDQGTLAWAWAATGGSLVVAIAVALTVPWADLPGEPWVTRLVGSLVALSGVALREWAILALGRLFTQSVMIREQHVVVATGPYRWLRHPAYTGTLLTLVGLMLTLDNWLSVAVVAVGFFVGHIPRIRVEERVLEENLGEPYREFERGRKRVVPGIW